MFAMLMIFLSDTASVDIRALVSQDIDRAAYHNSSNATGDFVEHLFGIPEVVLAIELALIVIMAGLFITLIVRFRRLAKEQKKKLESERRMGVKRPPSVSRTEIERILNQIATEKVKAAEIAAGSYFVDDRGKLDSGAAIHEMARTNHMEADRLNFAISYASQASKQSPQTGRAGAKFKEAFALVDEQSDLNMLARQLNMGRGELELILALKRSKIANSKTATSIGKRRTR
ncbi:MAG: hypothetical protein WAO19_08975 [Candidatus Kryptoniota bacterium]